MPWAARALAARFENGEIVDRFSFPDPPPAQLEAGMGGRPLPVRDPEIPTGTGHPLLLGGPSINWETIL